MMRQCLAIVVVLCLGDAIARGGDLSIVTSPGALGANDHLFWGELGQPGDHPVSGAGATSYGGVAATITQQGAPFLSVLTQSPAGVTEPGTGWPGNFDVGDFVLASTTGYGSGPLSISFAKSVSAVGAHVSSIFAGSFVAKIEAFDGAGISLGSFTLGGSNAFTADGSVIFLGVQDTVEEISRVEFSIVAAAPIDAYLLGIGVLQFASTSSVPGTNPDHVTPLPPPPSAVPEPAAGGMLAIAICGLLGVRRGLRRPA